MCHFSIHKQWKLHTSTKKLEGKLGIMDIEQYYNIRVLRWMGNLVRMSDERIPKHMLTAYVQNPRKLGRPQMNLGHVYEKVLRKSNISTSFRIWTEIAKDEKKWSEVIANASYLRP